MREIRFVVLLILLMALALKGELWTNQAGKVIEGTCTNFDGTSLTLVRPNGATLRLPLAALCLADQRRVRLLSGQSIAPEFVQAAYKDARTVLDRFHRLPEIQKTTEARTRAILMAQAVFDARIKTRAMELKDKTMEEEVGRLRHALSKGS